MIVAISYYPADEPLMVRWVNHVKSLGNYKNHKIVVAIAHNASSEGVVEPLKECFGEVIVYQCYHKETGWPVSCNMAFESVAWLAYYKLKQSFLWMEPDAVPLKASWIDDIEKEYIACGKPFMGDFIGIKNVMPNGVDHMSGIAVYHWNMPEIAPSVFNNGIIAWDIASGKHVVDLMHRTNLIHHDWIPDKAWRKSVVTKKDPKETAVIYHPDKKGVLFSDYKADSVSGVQGDPATGGGVVPSSSLHHTESAQSAPSPSTEIDQALNTLKLHYDNNRKLKKEILEKLATNGFIKPAKTKKRKLSGKKVQADLAVS